jgi:hypothetical protein
MKTKYLFILDLKEINMKTKYLINCVNNIFKKYNLKRKNKSWYYSTNECTNVFNLQKSSFGENSYFLNFGIFIKTFDENIIMPPEYKCHLRFRIIENDCWEYFNLENGIADKEREEGIEKTIKEIVMDKIYKLSTIDSIKDYYKNKELLKGMYIEKNAREYLGF